MIEIWNKIYRQFQDELTSWENENINRGKPEVLKYLKEYPSPRRVLDIGCGRGKYSKYLEELGYSVISIDISKVAVLITSNILEEPNIVICSADNLPFNNAIFDICLDIGTFHHILEENHIQYIEEISRVLKNEGVYLFSVFNTEDSYKEPKLNSIISKLGSYVYFFDKEYLKNLLLSKFDILNLEKISWKSLKTGAYHSAWIGICKKNSED